VPPDVRRALDTVARFRSDAPPAAADVIFSGHTILGATAAVTRRGPVTGLQYLPTVDPRFRRTERIRIEIPRAAGDGVLSARLLSRAGETLPVAVAVSEQAAPDRVVADLTLAPLAQGDYVFEVAVQKGGIKETALFGFRIIP
jgi:hypothetical protein